MVLKTSFVELSIVQKRRKRSSAPLHIYITLVTCLFIFLETLRREHQLATECFTPDFFGATFIPMKPSLQSLTSHAEHCSNDKVMIQNRPSPLSKKTKIPRSIHQFLHSKCVSPEVISSQKYPQGFGYDLHSVDSIYHLVIHNEWPQFPMLKQVTLNCKILHLLAPFVVLWEYGGVWVDWNIEMTESLLEEMDKELVVMNTVNNWPSMAVMSPHHPYIRDVIQHILWASLGENVDNVLLSTPSHSVRVETNFPLRYLEGRNSTFHGRDIVSCLSRVVGTDSAGGLLQSDATRQPPTTTTELLRLNISATRQLPSTQTGSSGALVQSTVIQQTPMTQTDSSGPLSRSNIAAMMGSNTVPTRQLPAPQTNSSGVLLHSTVIRQPSASQDGNSGALSRSNIAVALGSNAAAIQQTPTTQADNPEMLSPSTAIKLPPDSTQTNSSGTLLQLESALLRQPPHAQTDNSGAQLRLETAALQQPPHPQIDHSGVLLRVEDAVFQQPAPTRTENSGVQVLSGTVNATIQQWREEESVTQKQLRGAVQHHPNYFSDQVRLEQMMSRMNVLTPYTGCSIAAFQYNLFKNPHPEFNDCFVPRGKKFGRSRGIRVDNAGTLVKEGDTIYVQFNKLEHFVNKTMPNINVDFVLMSGQQQKVGPFSREAFDSIIANPRVIHWFMMNMDIYSYDPRHPKISPWPYGTNPKKLPDFVEELKKQVPEKNTFIHLTGFSRTTNPQRLNIPRGPTVDIKNYLSEMHRSKYIFSPDGDRPECYRHYEAIGMGTIPITQLDASTHSHLEGNAIFNNSEWNLTVLEATLPQNPQVNQRLIFEEYWMEYVERIVGRPLRWWDPSRDVRSSLAEITDIVAKIDTENATLP